MKTTVIIPTYNERENIAPLLDAILTLNVSDLSVLVVDDSSPDGTGAEVLRYAERDPRVSLFTRKNKEGLGRAYLAGFQEAFRRGADAVIQMDADFSHDPNDLPRLLHHLDHADLVIGSRYLHGGRVADWSPARRWLSRMANIYARLITGVPITDLTGGVKAWRSDLLKQIELQAVTADGYGFQIEMNTRAWCTGARVKEIPIVFEERRVGQSKLSKEVILEAVWLVWKLRFQRRTFQNTQQRLSSRF